MLVKSYSICYNGFTKKFLEVLNMTSKEQTTKNVTFRFDGEKDFQIQLVFEQENGKLIASSSSISFLDYLKSLNLVKHSEDTDIWFNICNGLTINCSSHPEYSFKIRMKANRWGLKIIPGKSFQEKRKRDCEVAFQRQHIATN